MNKKIRILRGTNEKIVNTPGKTLAAGQPLYNIDKNYLTIGTLKNGNEQPLSQLPITVRQIEGYYSDNDQIKNEDDGYYSVGPSQTGTLLLNAENSIEFMVRSGATGGAMVGGGSVGTPLTITPHSLNVNGVVSVGDSSMGYEDGKWWHSAVNISNGAIRSILYTDEGDNRNSGLALNDFGGDIYLSDNTSNIIITGNISDGPNSTTVENIVTKTGSQTISGTKTFTQAVTAPQFKSDNTEAGMYFGENNELDFGSNSNVLYIGYRNRLNTSGTISNYYFGNGTGPDGQTAGKIYCGELFENGTTLSTKYVTTGTTQTITGSKTFSGPLISTGTGNNKANISQASITTCGITTLNVNTINLITT